MKRLLIFTFTIILMLAQAGEVAACQGHTSCGNFGTTTGHYAREGMIGFFTSALATSSPNAVSNDNGIYHGVYCQQAN